jgi:hypothetical protein
MTSSRTEPATFQLVAQCLKQLHYRVLPFNSINETYIVLSSSKDKGKTIPATGCEGP